MATTALAVIVCCNQRCPAEVIIQVGTLPGYCPLCHRPGKWRYLVPAEVKQRIDAYMTKLETVNE